MYLTLRLAADFKVTLKMKPGGNRSGVTIV